jgi:hypothetical protein
MFAHSRRNKGNPKWYIRILPPLAEFITGETNLYLGYYYIRQVNNNVLFESIVYGFVIIETPELILKFVKQMELSWTPNPNFKKTKAVLHYNDPPKFKGSILVNFTFYFFLIGLPLY